MGKPNFKAMYPALYAAYQKASLIEGIDPEYHELDPVTQREVDRAGYQFYCTINKIMCRKIESMSPEAFEEYLNDREK